MSLPWSAQQREWLREMGFDVLTRRAADDPAAGTTDIEVAAAHEAPRRDAQAPTRGHDVAPVGLPRWLQRVARGIDPGPLLARAGLPRDPAARRAFWRALRPLRKAARRP